MRTVQRIDLKERLDEVIAAVKNGEIVEIWEGDICIAEVRPKLGAVDRFVQNPSQAALEPFPADFFTRPLPKAKRASCNNFSKIVEAGVEISCECDSLGGRVHAETRRSGG
jgi:antitoxin (DNA-binding transcriptional repressor) of toxin-antitoxin stability system